MRMMEAQMDAQFASLSMKAGDSETLRAFLRGNIRFSVTYGPYLSFLSILPFAVTLRRLTRGSGRTLAELVVFGVTVEAAVVLISAVVALPLMAWTGSTGLSISNFVLYAAFAALGARAFLGPKTAVRAAVSMVVGVSVYMGLIMVLGAAVGFAIAVRSHGG